MMQILQRANNRKVFPESKYHFKNLRDFCPYWDPMKWGIYLLVLWVAMHTWNRWSLRLRFCWPNLIGKSVPLYSRGWSYYAPTLCCCNIACRGRFGTKGKTLSVNLASILRWLCSSRLICSGRTPLWDVAWNADRSLSEYSTCKWMDTTRPKVSFFAHQ
jgi:hypothetical protein